MRLPRGWFFSIAITTPSSSIQATLARPHKNDAELRGAVQRRTDERADCLSAHRVAMNAAVLPFHRLETADMV
jgi:hypothetical protein